MTEEINMNSIIKTFEARWFMSVMSTGAIAILTNIIANSLKNNFLKILSSTIVYFSLIIFFIILSIFIIRIFKFKNEIIKDLKHPITSNFFAGISISMAVLTSAIINVLITNKHINYSLGIDLAFGLYIFSLIIGILLLILIPIMLMISKEVDSKHAIGIWFLPPVGMFVVIFAGNFIALKSIMPVFIAHLNLILFGAAFILYFLVLNLIYYRLKFHPLPAPEVAPSFVIGLAPIGVSIIATQTFVKLVSKLNSFIVDVNFLKEFVNIYSILIFGFGIWWFIVTLIILIYYIKNYKIPFTLGFWAFVFPISAFGIGLKFLSMCPTFEFICPFVTLIWILVFIIWIIVSFQTIKGIISKKIFIRPKL